MCSGGYNAPISDQYLILRKTMRCWIYYSTWLSCSLPPDQNGQAEMFCTRASQVPEA